MTQRHAGPELAGAVALVTGGGRGIGRLLGQALAGAGAAVGLIARSGDELAESARLITSGGGCAAAATADLSKPAAAERAIASLCRRIGPATLLVNNAGVGGPVGDTWNVAPGAWWQTIEVNLGSAFLCTRAVLPAMMARRAGRIVNITSKAGEQRWPQLSAYAVSKAAIIKLSENIASETRGSGVQVFSVDPGLLPIGLSTSAIAGNATPGTGEERRDAWVRQELAAGHGAEPAWIADLVIRLASGDADCLSGCHLSVHDNLDQMLTLAGHAPGKDLYRLRRAQPAAAAPGSLAGLGEQGIRHQRPRKPVGPRPSGS
jgi:NAD(P)-dependent dehydrogenase (short-subunit alcohol dehydrogenase family)